MIEFEVILLVYARLVKLMHVDEQTDKVVGDRESISKIEFRNFLRDQLQLCRFESKSEQLLFEQLISILTPNEKNSKPVISFRNIRCVIYAIFDTHQLWMNQQDQREQESISTSAYRRKITKYRLLITKLEANEIEAL